MALILPYYPCLLPEKELFEQSTVEIWKTAIVQLLLHLALTLGTPWLWVECSELCPVQPMVHYFHDASLLLLRELIFLYCGSPFPGFCPLIMKEKKKAGARAQAIWEIEEKVGIFNPTRLTMERKCNGKQTRLARAVGLMWFCEQKLTTSFTWFPCKDYNYRDVCLIATLSTKCGLFPILQYLN